MGKSGRLDVIFKLAIIQIPFREFLFELGLMLQYCRQLSTFYLQFLVPLVLFLTLKKCWNFRRRIHHTGNHCIVLHFYPLNLFFRTIVIVKMVFLFLEILNLWIVLLSGIRFNQFYEKFMIRFLYITIKTLLNFLFTERQSFQISLLSLFLFLSLLLWR